MPLKLIHVGVGGFGAGWTKVCQRSDEVEVVALVDVNQELVQETGKRLGIEHVFTDLDKALKKVEADALLDITPPMVRPEVTGKALRAGLHVLSEKPLADTLEHAKGIVRAAKEADRVFMVSQNYRYHRAPRTIRKLLRDQTLGELGYVVLNFHRGSKFPPGSFRMKMAYPLLIDMAIHHFDLMRCVLGTDAVRVRVTSWRPKWSWFDHEPTFSMVIEMADGRHVSYNGSWVSQGFETTWNGTWRIECSKGAMLWEDDVLYLSDGQTGRVEAELVEMPLVSQDYSLHEFAAAIREGRQPETSGADNLKSLAMVFAAVDSAKRGVEVEVGDYLNEQ